MRIPLPGRVVIVTLFSGAIAALALHCTSDSGTPGGTGGATGSGGHNASGSGGAPSGSGGATSGSGGAGTNGTGGGNPTGSGGGNPTGSGGARNGSGGTPGGSGGGTPTGSGGSPGGSGGSPGGSGGMSGGMSWAARICTGGPYTGNPIPAGASPTRIAGLPPADNFNNNGNNFTNVEGPVWIGDSLYVSELTGDNVPPARILKVGPGDAVSVFIALSGSNGNAADFDGNLLSADHGVHGIVRWMLPSGSPMTTLADSYNGKQLNSPNDLTMRSDGTIYFSDPSHQNNANPQGATRAYRLPPGSMTPMPITDYTNQPNGITLSLDEKTLYVDGNSGVKKYDVADDGSVSMTGTQFDPTDIPMGQGTDGMAIDCAGNLYVTIQNSVNVMVISPAGTRVGQISLPTAQPVPTAVTNVAFGGADHKTLYITGYGGGKAQGAYKVQMAIPGLPY